MSENFDVAVIGMGPGGEVVAGKLLAAGKKVAIFEKNLIGGECGYYACIPSKTLLRPPEAKSGVDNASGVAGAKLNWSEASGYRDVMIRHLDDSKQVDSYSDQGAHVVKEAARFTGPGTLVAGDESITADHIVVATGTEPHRPRLKGIGDVAVWTNREAYTATELPESAVVIGGSAVGVETSLFLARFGVNVTLLQRSASLLGREEPEVGNLAHDILSEAGVDVRLERQATRARTNGKGCVLELDDGSSAGGDVIVFATGRVPRTSDLNLPSAGAKLAQSGAVEVDESCRAADGLWAVGDVTGISQFTHVAKYQGRLVADAILGHSRPAHYEGIPRVVFSDPEIAAVGLTREQADQRGLRTVSTELDLTAGLARPWTYESDPRGTLSLLADADAGVLVGAWAVAPQSGEWIHQAALAIRAQIPIETLRDQVAQFPTYTEGFLAALDQLEL